MRERTKLLPFQEAGVAAMTTFGGRALLSDEMGLGKSIQALYWLLRQRAFPAVIVCPAFLKLHWQREAQQHCNLRTTILSGMNPTGTKALVGNRVFILNYEILGGWLRFLKSLQPKLVILDECHFIQSLRARRTRNARQLCQGVAHVIAISGTPLTNRPWELYPTLNILCPRRFPSAIAFGLEYCAGRREFGHWKFDGACHLKRLRKILLSACMVRRTKEEVLKQLPSLRRQVVPLEIEDRAQYDHAERDLISWLASWDVRRAAKAALDLRTHFGYLKRLAAKLKMKSVFAWVDSFLEESDGKLLLGAIHRNKTPIIPELVARYRHTAVQVHGGMTQKQRQSAVDQFRQDGNTRILVGQVQAAGVGLNLPECSTVAFCEFPWTPGACQQFWSRCHRLTSKSAVDVHFLIARDTIEERLCGLLQKKSRHLATVLDGAADVGDLPLLDELLESYRGKT